ncbi:NADH-quinone oxidoreductase subunit NuoN [Rhodobacteraceae bacterium NNCM2]|nr:NADH-quinone oxidoreductase subunit NuoN [Coraliihabitans acroporae]
MSADYATVLPEIIMAVGAMALLMWGVYGGGHSTRRIISWASAGLMVLVGLLILTGSGGERAAFDGAFVVDDYSSYAKILILFSSAVMLILGQDYLERRGILKFEYPVLILLSVLGMMMMVSSGGLISLYMGLELQSLALYVVAAFNRDSARSTEAGLKYFVLGALSSGLLLYGASLIYGYTGSVRFDVIGSVIQAEGVSLGLTFGLVFLCAALAFKISAAPFHMWTPDVYEGSPTPVTAFFATAPKVAAGILFARALFDGFGNAVSDWQQVLVFVSIASMFLGSIAAIGQTSLKRLMAYSSIGHMGFALVGLAAGTQEGADSLLLYLSIYVVMNVGVFAFILCMERDGRPVSAISDLSGLAAARPAQALALAVLMFSLAGLPPMVGFFAKFFVFKAAVDAGLAPLAIAGAIASVIGAFYYLNIVRVMYLNEAGEPLQLRFGMVHQVAIAISAIIMAIGWVPFLDGLGVPAMTEAAAASLLR